MSRKIRKTAWDESFEGWTVNFLRRNYWRVQSTMEWEDAMQEMRAIFCRVRSHYEGRNDGPRHIMALYKVACVNWLNVLSVKDSRRRSIEVLHTSQESMDATEALTPGDLDNLGASEILLSKLPEDLQDALRILYEAPAEVFELVCSSVRTGKRMKKANKALLTLSGNPTLEDPVGRIRKHFS